MKLEQAKKHHKDFKLTTQHRKTVSCVKPYPIPDLEGEAARIFEQQIREPPTETQKQMLREGAVVFAETKRK